MRFGNENFDTPYKTLHFKKMHFEIAREVIEAHPHLLAIYLEGDLSFYIEVQNGNRL
jgi:hypothetical protein